MTRISEILEIEVVNPDCKNPVYIRWVNLDGGYDYWLFEDNQRSTLITDQPVTYRKNYESLAESTSVLSVLKKTGREGLVLEAWAIPTYLLRGIREMALSPKVDVLVSWAPPDPPVWNEVIVSDLEVGGYNTANDTHGLTISILLPEFLTISN
jgi:hypothetical protein